MYVGSGNVEKVRVHFMPVIKVQNDLILYYDFYFTKKGRVEAYDVDFDLAV